jgi:leader peptidase (prepilin peptidase)/N-methyltransferase
VVLLPSVLAGLLGLLIGSFLNVVIYRVPLRKSIAHPPSACPECGHRLAWFENIPVVSWIVLRARCRECHTRISSRYPLVEVGTALLFAGTTAFLLATRTVERSDASLVPEIVAFLYLAAISIALTAIDLDTHTLPNVIVLPSYVVVVVLLATASLLDSDPGALLRAAIGAVALFAFYFAMATFYRGGMGLGDVKLAGVLGFAMAWAGWDVFAVGAFAPFLLGGVFGIALLLFSKAGRKTRIPFGPWMLVGAWAGIFAGPVVATAYLRLVGLA